MKTNIYKETALIIEKGVNGMYDEIIDRHMDVLRQQPFLSSVQHFIESGKITGNFRLQLRSMLKELDNL
ncbi:MAG TPA: hypothetical protein VIK55_06525 [Paludibacter sp.]